MTATEREALCARIDELCAENERLRSVVSDGADNVREIMAENAKLREHIADLWEFGFSKNAGANSIKEYLRKVDELRDRTYELLGVAK